MPKRLAPHLQVVDSKQLDVMTVTKLKEFIERYKDGPPTFLEHHWLMPPETAAYALKNLNWGNRKMRQNKVKDYSQFMGASEWVLNNTTLGFATTGRMLDGQQRCTGAVAARAPFPIGFCFGLPDDSFDTIDMGASRSHADVARSLGAKYPEETAVAIRWIQWITTKHWSDRKPAYSPQELPMLWEKFRDVEHWVPDARRIVRATQGWLSPGVIAAFLYVFHDIDAPLTVRFAEAWQSYSYGAEFLGIKQAQTRLNVLRDRYNIKGGDAYQTMRAALIIQAWNSARSYQRTGKHTKIEWSEKGNHKLPRIDGGPA
jgi:hypothetical protein